MKNVLNILVATLLLLLGSCSSDSKYQELNKKITEMDGQTRFTQEEYGEMLDYLTENVDAVMTTDDLADKSAKYPYFPSFMQVIMVADMRHELDQPNQLKFVEFMDKYTSYLPIPSEEPDEDIFGDN